MRSKPRTLIRLWTTAFVAWLGCSAMAQQPAPAESPAPATAAATNGVLSGSTARVLSPWQEHLTVGPGDAFAVSLYGQADSSRQVTIGPDGRINYLQATDVDATGLTVDELRVRLEAALKKFHLSPRAVVMPVMFNSKKYFILGNVAQKGVFTLDRPITIVEAVAKARGFVSGTQQRSSFTLVDLPHAFLVRRQADGVFAREPVDFEALFTRGDLSQNKLLAPDDYLYFPPTGLEQVYTLGEVATPGVVPFTQDLSTLGAITARGGFTEAAFRQKILVVRGSLERPETFVVDVSSALRAATPDFRLQPRDIVYVSRKPWAKAEELLEAASSDFIRAMVVAWTGRHIQPLSR